jgi:two-component system sensor histidine kinase NreB
VIYAPAVDRWVQIRAYSLHPGQVVGLFYDVTERKNTEEEARSQLVQIELQRRLLEQREQERQQIARDLHDGPMQEILAVIYALQGMAAPDADTPVRDDLKGVIASLQQQLAELRTYAGELRPPTLVKFGLEKAIRSHAETFQEKHPEVRIQVQAGQEGPLLPQEVRVALFRIYQEAMNNIARHCPHATVNIRFQKGLSEACLEICDDGPGFNLPHDWLALARGGHLGLVGMRERAEAVGGTLEVRSQLGQGTCIRVTAPLAEDAR